MKKAKYAIENSLAMRAGFRQLVQQVDFDDPDVNELLKQQPCHIYMICSRPRITFLKEKLKITKDRYSVGFMVHDQKNPKFFEAEFPNNLGYVSFELADSLNRIRILGAEGQVLTEGKSSLMYPLCIQKYEPDLDLEVLYVGQAFGKDGHRLASHRLNSHDTLQKIYADAMDKNPSKEVWLILWQFHPYYISMLGAATYDSLFGFDKSFEIHENTINYALPMDQQITVTEAALIKYFSPFYNTEYKTTFPDSSHSSYEVCYQLDLNSVAFELDTNSIVTRLYSDTIQPSIYHVHNFFLHSNSDRKDMFKISDWK